MRVLETMAVGAIRAYQWLIRPILPMSCRFWPSCSEYAIEALRRHGPWHGGILASWRLLRCHPWGGSGIDPVPARFRLSTPDQAGHGADCARPRHDHI